MGNSIGKGKTSQSGKTVEDNIPDKLDLEMLRKGDNKVADEVCETIP